MRVSTHGAHVRLQALSLQVRQLKFMDFHEEILKGTRAKGYLSEYALAPLPDVQFFREYVSAKQLDKRNELWAAILMIWLGTGGVGAATFKHLVGETLHPDWPCLPAFLMPFSVVDTKTLEDVYAHVCLLSARYGQDRIFAGDGTYVKFRLGPKQGLRLLQAMHLCVKEFPLERNLSPMEAKAHFKQKKFFGFGDLALKELWCYGASFDCFDPGEPPFGTGALRGAALVLGTCTATTAASKTKAMLQRHGRPWTVLEMEISFCWYQSYLKCPVKPPASWNSFKRSVWGSA